jgi:hypothetical protein
MKRDIKQKEIRKEQSMLASLRRLSAALSDETTYKPLKQYLLEGKQKQKDT